ncbi:hypothetical protein P879_00767 [Paragonimus westermani]|uniref:MAP kinase-activating death domain protein n=1 Tax=Paragonimus westermani TaxID=34504 RepID=A0A8T0DUC4_9TREM|nr:hypothetical protein P879_00767 [Paragonimus westermani]
MQEFCPRLVDYIVLVGSHSGSRTSSTIQTPVILNRFPPVDHADFVLPPDVALFCQPEGCFNTVGSHPPRNGGDHSVPKRSPVSFVFTLTDKESSKMRYGVCFNFFRPIHRRAGNKKQNTTNGLQTELATGVSDLSTHDGPLSDKMLPVRDSPISTSKPHLHSSNRLRTHTLTSLCLISHHPFFTKFRALVEFLHTLIHKLHERSRSKLRESETVWGVLTGAIPTVTSPLVIRSVHEIEVWILRLLSAPAPVPGKTCLHLSVQPKSMMKPMIFALPDKSRLPLVDFPLHLPIQSLGIARTLRILVCLLLEQKVVIQSADYNRLSLCVLAFTAMLYPLQYMFPIIPLLPPCMAEAEQLLIAPTPYIIGVPTSFYAARKIFRMPKDVWVANLDTQELSYPEVLEEIPDLPEPECTILIRHLNLILSAFKALSTLPPSKDNRSLDLALSEVNRLRKSSSASNIIDYNPLNYISDEASTSVATRVALILFLSAKNILGGMAAHTRTLRLYPRPVVAFQFECFMKSRPRPCLFTSMLARSQAVEYFAEAMLCAHNEAYQRVVAGEYAPELIGDKAQWFASLLTPVLFDTWPEAVTGRPSMSDSTNAFIGSPLLYALVAARLHASTVDSSVFMNGSDRNTEQLLGDVSKTLSAQDEFSDYPTDESASDTETEHSTTSVGSTVSDVTSDHLDSGIGEIQHKSVVRAPPDSDRQVTTACDSATKLHGSDPQTTEPVFVCPGEPLPPNLAIHFNPPTQPMLGLSREHTLEANTDVQPGLEDIPDELSSQTTTDAISTTPENENGRDRKNSQPPSPTDTLRAFTKASVSMFSGGSSRKGSTLDDARHSVLTDGRINWGSPFFVLLGELFNLNTNFSNELMRSDEGAREWKKRLDEERYLIQAAKSICEGNAPGIFSRNRFVTLLQSESNRNLLLSRLNRCNTLPLSTGSDEQQQYVEDVPIDHWNQYKAIVRTLHQVASGLESSLRSDIFIPTPASIYTPRAQNTNSIVVPLTNGGLASAFGLFELAHTHYYQLPMRATRTTRPSFATAHFPSGNDLPHPLSSVGSASSLRSDVTSGPDSSFTSDGNHAVNNGMQGSSSFKTAQLNNKQYQPTSPSSYCRTVSTVPLDVASDSEQLGMNVLLSRPMRSMSGGRAQSGSVQSPISPLFEHQSGPYQYISSVSGTLPPDEFITPKSSHSRGYRYRHSKLIKPVVSESSDNNSANTLRATHRQSLGTLGLDQTVNGTDQVSTNGSLVRTNRTYVFEDLLANSGGTRLQLWDNMQFWEDAFLDAVAQERDILGMDFRPTDLLKHYSMTTPLKKKHAELAEDKLLAGLMHNMIAFMIMMGVNRVDIRRKIRRLLAKSHMGLHYSQEISNLLDMLEYLYGNDIDLKQVKSRAIPHHSYEVYRGINSEGKLLFMEVGEDHLLLRNLSGCVIDRWCFILCISVRLNGQSNLNLFYTKKCQLLYQAIEQAMEQMTHQSHRGPLASLTNSVKTNML